MTFVAGQILTADDLNEPFEDTGWVNITTSGGFAIQDQPQVRRIGGVVYARGGWSNTGMSINSVHNVGTLPAGFEPAGTSIGIRWTTSTGATSGTGFVLTTGAVQVRTGGALSAYYQFGGNAWLID